MMVRAHVCISAFTPHQTLWFQHPVQAVVLSCNRTADNMRIDNCKERLQKNCSIILCSISNSKYEIIMRNFVNFGISNMLSRGVR